MLSIGEDEYRIDFVSVRGSYVVIFAEPMAQVCYDGKGKPTPDTGTGGPKSLDGTTFTWSLEGTPFTFSKSNKLVNFGCNRTLMANFFNRPGDLSPLPQHPSCTTTCTTPNISGSCLGEACCEAPMDQVHGAKALSLSFERTTANGTGDGEEDGTCRAAFFLDKDEAVFTFGGEQVRPLKKALLPQGERRMILDWAIGSTTCDQAQSYTFEPLCKYGTCVDAPSGSGYLCKCPDGYDGNAYVSDGCQDINECRNYNSNNCTYLNLCNNTLGGYTCSCPKNNIGDGYRTGTGCNTTLVTPDSPTQQPQGISVCDHPEKNPCTYIKYCIDSEGVVSCACPEGMSGDGRKNGSFNLMACLKEIPILKGNNYTEWRKKIEFSFVCGEVDWVLTTPQPQAPQKPVRADGDDDAAWQQKERDYAPLELAYTLENKQWTTANKKCMALVKNTIEPAILGSIAECDSVSEYLDKIRNQFTGSSKIYATQLFKQLATERYNGGGTGIRDHIMRMYNLAAQLKPMDLELKPGHIMHLVFASLPKEFDTFVVNYNMQPEQWDMEKMIAMCVQEEDRLRSSHGGSLHYVKDNRKKIANPSFKARGKAPMQQNHQKLLPVDKDQCLHCKKKGHFKKDCPDWLKSIMAKRGIPFDEDYAKKRKMR